MSLSAGRLANKDAEGVFAALRGVVDKVFTIGFAAPAAGDPAVLAAAARAQGLAAEACPDATTALEKALAAEGQPPHLIIAGSLYLAGEVLGMAKANWPS